MKKRPVRLAVIVALAAVLAGVAYTYVSYGVVEHKTLDVQHTKSVQAAIDDSDKIIEELRKDYPTLADRLSDVEPRTYAIPGLVRAKIIYAKGRARVLSAMPPTWCPRASRSRTAS